MGIKESVRKMFDYDGRNLLWAVKPSRCICVGDVAGSKSKSGYIVIGINKERYYAHRLIWLYIYGKFPKDQIDHINGDPSDNNIFNLRSTSQAENTKNRMISSNNTSGVMGVSWMPKAKKYQAYIDAFGKRKNLGSYSSLNEAAKVRAEAEVKYKFHPNHGRKLKGKR